MTESEWKRIVRPVLPADGTWALSRMFAYRRPTAWILAGVLAESSSHERSIRLWRVTMPLFVPTEAIVLSYSAMVDRGARWGPENVDGLRVAIQAEISRVAVGVSVASFLAGLPPPGQNLVVEEARGYASLLTGDIPGAERALLRVTGAPVMREWESAVIARAAEVQRLLGAGSPDRAIELLARSRKETLAALGVSAA